MYMVYQTTAASRTIVKWCYLDARSNAGYIVHTKIISQKGRVKAPALAIQSFVTFVGVCTKQASRQKKNLCWKRDVNKCEELMGKERNREVRLPERLHKPECADVYKLSGRYEPFSIVYSVFIHAGRCIHWAILTSERYWQWLAHGVKLYNK